MKVRYIFYSIVSFLIISTIIGQLFFFNHKSTYQKKSEYTPKTAYILYGQNSNWLFEYGLLILDDDMKYFSSESLSYIGAKKLETTHFEVKITVNENNTDKIKDVLLSVIHESKTDSDIINDNHIPLGENWLNSPEPVKYDYSLNSDAYISVEIKYDDNGKMITENLKLRAKNVSSPISSPKTSLLNNHQCTTI